MANHETMTVHKALAELKVLDDRILAAISACNLVTTKKNNQDKVRGKTVAEFTTDAKAAYDKATDLIKRRNAIKDAVNVSNANTIVKISDQEYTVVQAIDKKNHGMDFSSVCVTLWYSSLPRLRLIWSVTTTASSKKQSSL